MNYLFLTKTAFFNGLSENEIKTIKLSWCISKKL